MTVLKLRRIALLSLGLFALVITFVPTAPAIAKDWSGTVSQSGMQAYVLGNPAAPHRLTIWVSYTCPHCAHFDTEAMALLKTKYVAKGALSLEVRNLLRDPFDITAALLARCGGKSRFFNLHSAFMANQDRWLNTARAANADTQKSWYQGNLAERAIRISKGTGLDAMAAKRGIGPALQKKCLADQNSLDALKNMTSDALNTMNVRGTPSFALDGKLVDANDWSALKPRLDAL